MRTYVIFIKVALLASAIGGAAASALAQDVSSARPMIAPASLPEFGSDRKIQIPAPGRWLVINYWATWCAPCRREIPIFNSIADSNPDVRVVGIAVDEGGGRAVSDFIKTQIRPRYPVAVVTSIDGLGELPPPLIFPTTMVIAPDGRIVRTFLGEVGAEQVLDAVRSDATQ
jgi:thiol-disulfide isomerase/thioredoxin